MSVILDEELMGLSEEEREALSGEDDAEDRALLQSLLKEDGAGDADGDDGADQEDEVAAQDEERPVQDLKRGDAAAADALAAEPGAETAGPGEFQPVYVAPPVEGYADLMAGLAQQQAALAKGYEDGDYDLAEYQAKLRQLTEQEWLLRERQLKANLAQEQRAQQMTQRWQWEQERFFSQPVNKAYREDPVIGQAFAAAVQMVAADAKNDARPMSWFLEEADRITRQRFRLPGDSTAGGQNQAGAASASKGRNGRGRNAGQDQARVPPTLGGLPAASIPDVGGDEFSRLDRLEGMELEMALSRLSQAEADRYLNARAA